MLRLINKTLLYPVLHYVESHYRHAGLPSLFFRKEPHILFDMPRRLDPGQDLPVFCIIKDADRFPVTIKSILIKTHGGKLLYHEDCDIRVKDFIYYHLCLIPRELLKPYAGHPLDIIPGIEIAFNNKIRRIIVHNYKQLSHLPLKVFIAEKPLPGSDMYLWSDLHTHSIYTHNQVEFGAPISVIAQMSSAFGLPAAAITDHSFDLDDAMGIYHQPDKTLPRWHALQNDINTEQDFIFISGEEISCGNDKHKNVHLLVYNYSQYIYGDDDNSGGNTLQRPTISYQEIFTRTLNQASVFAAHPAEKTHLIHNLLLHRGNWDIPRTRDVHGFQIFNGFIDKHTRKALRQWTENLIRGRKQYIIAGNDAHGNFNRLQKVVIPNLLLSENTDHYYGRQRTGLLQADSRTSAIEAISNGRMIVSNSYSLRCEIENVQHDRFILGDHAQGNNLKIHLQVQSNSEYGPFKHVRVYFGNFQQQKEILLWHNSSMRFNLKKTISFKPSAPGYIRVGVTDRYSAWKRFAFSNPIWIN